MSYNTCLVHYLINTSIIVGTFFTLLEPEDITSEFVNIDLQKKVFISILFIKPLFRHNLMFCY